MLLSLEDVSFRYRTREGFALKGLDLAVASGECVGVFGPSGCGKSTAGQIAAGILRQTEGRIVYRGALLRAPFKGEARRGIQMLFQHPEVSFNPKLTLMASMREPYRFRKIPFSEKDLRGRLEPYGIYPEHLTRRPQGLSGGELQRLALARIMFMEPRLAILDEPTSMLDVVSQAQIIGLLRGLRAETGLACLFVSHDQALCEAFCDRILVMEGGRLS
ncbi:MAG: ATP-binding cassette domain-containing protein [Deltaproteobacteria bacterium]|jgi:peptide/nickel transport system ATP-binding protein|nr:ATP-binding cassette domain-containing protein [Deltaproteobacteria bacterium]